MYQRVRGTGRASLQWRWPQSTDACDSEWWPGCSTAGSSPRRPDRQHPQLMCEAEIYRRVQRVRHKQNRAGGQRGAIGCYPVSDRRQGLLQSPCGGLTSPEKLNHSFVHHDLVVAFAELLQSFEVFQRLVVPPSLWRINTFTRLQETFMFTIHVFTKDSHGDGR